MIWEKSLLRFYKAICKVMHILSANMEYIRDFNLFLSIYKFHTRPKALKPDAPYKCRTLNGGFYFAKAGLLRAPISLARLSQVCFL